MGEMSSFYMERPEYFFVLEDKSLYPSNGFHFFLKEPVSIHSVPSSYSHTQKV